MIDVLIAVLMLVSIACIVGCTALMIGRKNIEKKKKIFYALIVIGSVALVVAVVLGLSPL